MKNSHILHIVNKNALRSYQFKAKRLILLFFFLFCGVLKSQTLIPEQIYEQVNDAVVVIYAYDYNGELTKQGSGVVLNYKGYVVTNYHVLAGCERLEVMHGKVVIPYVDIIGIDVEKDILILKIEERKFPFVKVGDIKKLKIGQRVYAIGSPMGLENTISEGIISGLRSYKELSKNYIQITASISSGSSGGAVVNDKGELIGISTLTVKDGQNLNFAIPINEVLNIEINSYAKENSFKNFELFYKGYNAIELGDYKKAVEYFSRFIEIFPDHAEAYDNRGIANHNLLYYLSAIEDYTKALELNPNNADTYYNRGLTKIDIGNYTEAINDFNKAIEINPYHAESYMSRGLAKDYAKDNKGALGDYNKSIEIDPLASVSYYNRGNTKVNLEDYRGAIQDFSKAIEINPLFNAAYNNRGVARYLLGDYYTKIKDGYDDATGNYKSAIQDLSIAIKNDEKNAIAYFIRGKAKYLVGDIDGACLDWSKAGELGEDYAYVAIKDLCK